jgi:hypothetical protein
MSDWLSDLQIDVRTTILVLVIGLIVVGGLLIIHGIKLIRYGTTIEYYQKRKKYVLHGLRMFAVAIIVAISAVLCSRFGEPLVYQVYIPSPTSSITPSITPSPTITLTPTITMTPTVTQTPSITPIPEIPDSILDEFEGSTEIPEEVVFSPLAFSNEIDDFFQAVSPSEQFQGDDEVLYGSFTYNNMVPGLQWTILWLDPDDIIICYESIVWGNFTGGYGYSECSSPGPRWKQGEYQVQMFLGTEWLLTGRFSVGDIAPEDES